MLGLAAVVCVDEAVGVQLVYTVADGCQISRSVEITTI
jgi:hypothetical protein